MWHFAVIGTAEEQLNASIAESRAISAVGSTEMSEVVDSFSCKWCGREFERQQSVGRHSRVCGSNPDRNHQQLPSGNFEDSAKGVVRAIRNLACARCRKSKQLQVRSNESK